MSRKPKVPRTRQSIRSSRISGTSSSTASGIPGLGRTVHDLFSVLGRALERFVDHVLERWSGGPNALICRMLLIQAGKPSCPCSPDVGRSQPTTALDPQSTILYLLQYASFHCCSCFTSYPDIVLENPPFFQNCARLVACIRCVMMLYSTSVENHR